MRLDEARKLVAEATDYTREFMGHPEDGTEGLLNHVLAVTELDLRGTGPLYSAISRTLSDWGMEYLTDDEAWERIVSLVKRAPRNPERAYWIANLGPALRQARMRIEAKAYVEPPPMGGGIHRVWGVAKRKDDPKKYPKKKGGGYRKRKRKLPTSGDSIGEARRPARISITDPATMTPAAINKEVKALRDADSVVTGEMIAQGRGSERYSDTMAIFQGPNPDPLTVEWGNIALRLKALQDEKALRAGPRYVGDLQRIHKKRR